MPVYGKNKVKEMMRSILPSTERANARYSKSRIKREDRRRIKQVLKADLGFIDDDDYESYIDESIDLKDDLQKELSPVIRSRRGNDKVNHFIRWAKAITSDIEDGSKVSHVKSISPKSIIGEHAVSHLDNVLEVKNPYKYLRAYDFNYKAKRLDVREYEWFFKYILIKDIRMLNLFNKAIQEKNPKKELTRTLKNLEDVQNFIDDIIKMAESNEYKKVSFVRKTSKVIYAPKRTKDKDLKNPRAPIPIHTEHSRIKITYRIRQNYNPHLLEITRFFIKRFIARMGDYQMIKNDLRTLSFY